MVKLYIKDCIEYNFKFVYIQTNISIRSIYLYFCVCFVLVLYKKLNYAAQNKECINKIKYGVVYLLILLFI